ncbi:MAG: T9SS type A sorting domain-containing protein [Bacteroidia bacterium]
MKKHLQLKNLLSFFMTAILFFFTGSLARAQSIQTSKGEIPVEFERTPSPNSTSGGDVSYWFNYGEDIWEIADAEGGDVSYFRNFLFPDSTVLVEFSDGLGSPWKHSLGQVFDPVGPLFSVLSPEVNQFTDYTLDSIGFFYRYYRFQDSAPDTLIVQVYEDDKIGFQPDPGWTSGASYATVEYDYETRIGSNPSQQYTYLLTNDDTISTTQGYLTFPVNISIPAGEKVAATITYIPGNPFNTGDTLDVYVEPSPTNQRNAFIVYEYRDNDFNLEAGYYNNQLNATTDVRYNINTNGWNGSYIPGTAWNAGFYHLDMGFLITFNPSGISENLNRMVSLFPNPVDENLTLTISENENEKVSVSIIDIAGREVYSVAELNLTSENKNIVIDTESLTQGVYFCRVSGQAFSETIRFVKK